MMALLKFLAALVVFAVSGCHRVWYVREVRDRVAVPQLEDARVAGADARRGEAEEVEPGDLAFERAVELVATGRYEEAEEKLRFIVNFDPGSGAADGGAADPGRDAPRPLAVDRGDGGQVGPQGGAGAIPS